jgi:Ca2+-transporting ATPase
VLTRRLVLTVGLVGLAMAVALVSLIQLGKTHYGSVAIGQSIAFTAFALMLIVAAFESRSETESVLTVSTFESKTMNWVAFAQVVLAVAATQLDGFRRVLGTQDLNIHQFSWALLPPIALFVLWELGKLLSRRLGSERHRA